MEEKMDNKEAIKRYNDLASPPAYALKEIQGGRLKGMTDIKPQWRIQVMVESYGECGIGWKFDIKRLWTEAGSDNQIIALAEINLFTKHNEIWSAPIPGVGGAMLIEKERKGLHTNDEAFKMAITDALSSAMKLKGVAAKVYMGFWDGSKYREPPKVLSKDEAIERIKKISTIPELNNWYKKHSDELAGMGLDAYQEIISACVNKKEEIKKGLQKNNKDQELIEFAERLFETDNALYEKIMEEIGKKKLATNEDFILFATIHDKIIGA
jgi:hypothetical protein